MQEHVSSPKGSQELNSNSVQRLQIISRWELLAEVG